MNNTKIIATLGPASSSEEIINAMAMAGVNVFRCNFSHGTHETHAQNIKFIRMVEQKINKPLAILADLQGPKLRIGGFTTDKISLEAGQKFILKLGDELGNNQFCSVPHHEIFASVAPNHRILINDGVLSLKILATNNLDYIETQVENSAILSARKGINLPDSKIAIQALTDKDKIDCEFALSQGVDWVALSFVQSAQDIMHLKDMVHGRAGVMAKIEKPQALEDLDNILNSADAVMVARGDLGVELPPEQVPFYQREIITKARHHGCIVVVATQMLESMIHNPTPTRAEVSDVATAVYLGADAVMLSAESASGSYPIKSIEMMGKIIHATENNNLYYQGLKNHHPVSDRDDSDAISYAACRIAQLRNCAIVACFSTTGATILRASRVRSGIPILGLTPFIATARRMALAWGVVSVRTRDVTSFSEMVGKATRIARRENLCQNGDKIVVTAGVPFGTPGQTNSLRIAVVGEHEKN